VKGTSDRLKSNFSRSLTTYYYSTAANYDLVTSHWSYLERLKYKTAKPLLHAVCRTRNQKQFGKKWSGKEISFETVKKTVSTGAEVMSGGRLLQRQLPASYC